MKTLTIPQRIALGLALLVAVGVGLGAISLWRITSINRHVLVLSGNSVPTVVTLSRVVESNFVAMKSVRSALIEAADGDRAGVADARRTFGEAVARGDALCRDYGGLISDDRDREIFTEARTARTAFLEKASRTLDVIEEGRDADARALMRDEVEPAAQVCIDTFNRDVDHNVELVGRVVADAAKTVRSSFVTIGAAIGLASLLGLLLGLGVIRSTTSVLRSISDTLEESAAQAAVASGQLATISQTVASGCSEQGSSVAETSAALEQMSAMIRSTAGNAAQAKELAMQARTAAEHGGRLMADMNTAMTAIEGSSAEVAKIVKDIDEIAFQTNILAINAAVEAARAGEAGAGFAVVADEVRSLAQRSAAAARETAAKIEAAITSSRQGAASCDRVGDALEEIATKVAAADTLVAEMATAAREQSQGIGQIGSAMTELDKVTQENAARAEEGASASAELTSQAKVMREHVVWLRSLVARGGGRPQAITPRTAAADRRPALPQRPAAARIPMPGDGAAGDAEDRHFKDF